MKLLSIGFTLFFFTANCFAAKSICDDKSNFKADFKQVSAYVETHPVVEKNISGASLKENTIVRTKDNEFAKITFDKPFKLEVEVFPNTSVQLTRQADLKCGSQYELKYGKITVSGFHPTILEEQKEICGPEVATDQALVTPEGTTYTAEKSALNDAIAELNGEPAGSQETFSVARGVISVKLKKLSKNKNKNILKYAKNSKNKTIRNGKNFKVAKGTKIKSKSRIRLIAQNEKIKLKKGAKLKITRNKKMKKTQTAELEIYDPTGEN